MNVKALLAAFVQPGECHSIQGAFYVIVKLQSSRRFVSNSSDNSTHKLMQEPEVTTRSSATSVPVQTNSPALVVMAATQQ